MRDCEDELELIGESTRQIQYLSSRELCSKLNSKKIGLTTYKANERRQGRLNKIPPPIGIARWFCCLLSCLGVSSNLDRLREITPDCAIVMRDGTMKNLDPVSIVEGDIVNLREGTYVPADMRVLESDECAFDTSMLNGKVEMFVADPNICSNFVTESPNILLAGYKCVSGSCAGIVIAIGEDTHLAKLIRDNKWSPGVLGPQNRDIQYAQV